ncbi:MAG: IgGFc-binding protein [Bacteroidales bacterium]|nr:IgGFc-binding protein [Bacteroidales bacterium]
MRHFIKRLIFALVLLCGSQSVFSQVDTAFWFAVPKLTTEHEHTPITLVVSTLDQAATVTVTKAYSGTQVGSTLNVAANSSSTLTLVSNSSGLSDFECAHNTTSNKGLYIHSTAKINAYVAVQQNNSEIYALKGGNGLGTNFFVTMQYQFDNGNGASTSAYSQAKNSVEIIATENNTTVTITPSYACGTHAANVPFTVTLQRGQVYCFASNSQTGANHLCGTTITSDKPVVVDVSDDSVTPHCSETSDQGTGSADLVADQLVPIEMAGGQYIVVPSPAAVNNNAPASSGGGNHYLDYAFVFALENNTNVTIYSGNANNPTINNYTLNSGEKQKFHFTNQTPIFIYATHTDPNTGQMEEAPVFVFQVTGAGKEFGGTQLPHVYCTGSTAASYCPLQSAQNHQKKLYLTLLCNSAYTAGFQINGNTNIISASDWHDIPGAPAFKYCCKDVSTNYSPTYNNMIPFRVTNTLGKFHMGVFDINGTFNSTSPTYDDCSISYFSSYTSGSSIAWNPIVTHSDYCQGDTIIFDFPNFRKYPFQPPAGASRPRRCALG